MEEAGLNITEDLFRLVDYTFLMNILSDFHQSDLYYSLQLLFEKRLGYNLFSQIGLDWYEQGFWNVYPSIDTAKQYLDIRDVYIPSDGTLPLNTVTDAVNGHYIIEDRHNKALHEGITLDAFKEMDIGIVIASIPQHIEPFKELATMKNAKFIFQMGNYFPEVKLNEIPNLMYNSCLEPIPGGNCNAVSYHQEFDLNIFKPIDLMPKRLITSFINILNGNGGSTNYYALKARLPEFEFKSYGAQNDDGVLNTTEEIASQMQQSMFTYMVKSGADGYGFNLHESFACGRPVIINYSEYKDRIGGKLLVPDETCIVLEVGDNIDVVADKIQNIPPIQYEFMRQACYDKFKEVVDFDREQKDIELFLSKLQ